VKTLLLVKAEPSLKSVPQLDPVIERPQEELLIIERPPQPLDKNVVLDPIKGLFDKLPAETNEFLISIYEPKEIRRYSEKRPHQNLSEITFKS
jgi:hypothetical protein